MTVAFDAATLSSTFTSTSPFTFTHTPVGTPKGVTVGVDMIVAAGTISAVSYGGVSVPVQLDKVSSNSQSEQGRAWIGFLGSGIPTGAQTVSVTNNGSGFQCQVSVVTYTAGADTELADSDFTVADTDDASVVSTSSGTALRHGVYFSGYGQIANITLGAGLTAIGAGGHSNGFRTSLHTRETSPSSGAFTFGYTGGAVSECALVVLAVQEGIAPITGTAAGVQAAQVMAMSGTNTPPFVPPVPGQNRMGGTGAIRKPPR